MPYRRNSASANEALRPAYLFRRRVRAHRKLLKTAQRGLVGLDYQENILWMSLRAFFAKQSPRRPGDCFSGEAASQ